MAQSKDSISRTLIVALLLSVAFSVIVSTAAVALRPVQTMNEQLSIRSNMLAAAGMLEEGASAEEVRSAFDEFEVLLVEMGTGKIVPPETVGVEDAAEYDDRRAARDPKLSHDLENDPAGINRQVDYAKAYVLRDDSGEIKRIVLPVHGYGLWSTMYGFLALEGDANTVVGLGFYEHAETPGLGGEIENPRWQAQWPGKKVYDKGDWTQPRLQVVKAPRSDDHDIDALSGATLTSRGVDNMMKFWLGEQGYAQFLKKARQGEV